MFEKTVMTPSASPLELSPKTFDRVRKLIYDKAGIDLRAGKESLVAARLGKQMRESGLRSYDDYMDRVAADRTGESLIALIDALTTNYTLFLRERDHFDFLRATALPGLASRTRIDVWCAAAATGEEPYTLAFTLLDAFGPGAVARCRILATDISTRALRKAGEGVYAADKLAGIPAEWRSRFMLAAKDGTFQVKPEVKRMIEYRRLNLIEPFNPGAAFPLIFCRNVMIYFDRQTQEAVVNRLTQYLEPGGYLMIGHAESLSGIKHKLKFVKPAVYQLCR